MGLSSIRRPRDVSGDMPVVLVSAGLVSVGLVLCLERGLERLERGLERPERGLERGLERPERGLERLESLERLERGPGGGIQKGVRRLSIEKSDSLATIPTKPGTGSQKNRRLMVHD